MFMISTFACNLWPTELGERGCICLLWLSFMISGGGCCRLICSHITAEIKDGSTSSVYQAIYIPFGRHELFVWCWRSLRSMRRISCMFSSVLLLFWRLVGGLKRGSGFQGEIGRRRKSGKVCGVKASTVSVPVGY